MSTMSATNIANNIAAVLSLLNWKKVTETRSVFRVQMSLTPNCILVPFAVMRNTTGCALQVVLVTCKTCVQGLDESAGTFGSIRRVLGESNVDIVDDVSVNPS